MKTFDISSDKVTMDMLEKWPATLHSDLGGRKQNKGTDLLDPDVSMRNLLDAKYVFGKIGLVFWLNYGTLLGAYRDGKFIKYDRDTDIATFLSQENINKLNHALPELRRMGFGVVRINKHIVSLYRDDEYIDLNFYSAINETQYATYDYGDGGARKVAKPHYDSLIEWAFKGDIFNIPFGTEDLLTYWYGQDWMIPQAGKYAYICDSNKLSILICHLADREVQIKKLLTVLGDQARPDIEILVETDDGTMSIGEKRNILLSKAKGDYVCFIDDDDEVPEYYVEEILKAIESKPDCVGFNGAIVSAEGKRDLVSYRKGITQVDREGEWFRAGIGHLSPVKREIAVSIKFPEKNSAEDYEYAKELQEKLTSEAVIDKFMYFYLMDNK